MIKIDYKSSNLQMGDLLLAHNVKRDIFSESELSELRSTLEKYMTCSNGKPLEIDLKNFILVIKGADEAGYLYQYL